MLHHHQHQHQSLNRKGRWGTTDDFATGLLHIPCSSLPSGTCRTLGLSIPWCCLPTCSSACLVFFPLSLRLARWFWPDLMNGRHDHNTAVCISLLSSRGLRVVRLPAGSWHGLFRLPITKLSLVVPEGVLTFKSSSQSFTSMFAHCQTLPCSSTHWVEVYLTIKKLQSVFQFVLVFL